MSESVYCAIYTRKSTSEGLNQDFTTLDSQREAGLNYIASQKGNNWVALSTKYDDGGYTGGNMERPALKRLMKDINAGNINCIVVYKVDRLSRSLIDFAKLLDYFDKHNVSFVSVTQNFNTHTSMGRLTLNILLSFAQFEREIISERTRDTMGMARKKGRWLGGVPMLGYRVDKETRILKPIPTEAETVREIFRLYLETKSLRNVVTILNTRGIRTKRHELPTGKVRGDRAFTRAAIYTILSNCTYIGKIKYGEELFDGIHDTIIQVETFQAVQKVLANNRERRIYPQKPGNASLLRHILWCADCHERMLATSSQKNNVTRQYYICRHAKLKGFHSCPTKSISAPEMDAAVLEKLKDIAKELPDNQCEQIVTFSEKYGKLSPQERRRAINLIIKTVEYSAKRNNLTIMLNFQSLADVRYEFDVRLRPVQHKTVKIKESPKIPAILKSLVLAYQIADYIKENNIETLKEFCRHASISAARGTQLMRLLQLSPRIQEAILLDTDERMNHLSEHELREITHTADWPTQHQKFDKLAHVKQQI